MPAEQVGIAPARMAEPDAPTDSRAAVPADHPTEADAPEPRADDDRRRPGRGPLTALPRRWWNHTVLRLYVLTAGVTALAVTVMMRLWRVDWTAPFYYGSDAIGSAAHFKTTLETGWYESQPRLGVPYGQHYHDFPFSDDLHPAMAKLLGFVTGNWIDAFNGYYLLTFLLCGLTAVWFFRVCGLSGALTVVLSVLFAVAPYHLVRNETHLFLSAYYLIPPAMALVMRAIRGERMWGRRAGVGRLRAVLTGRGAGTTLILALLVWDGVYYAIFFALLFAAAGLMAFGRTRDRTRFGGAVMVGVVLVAWYVVALLPDLLYARIHGSNGDAFLRVPDEAQFYALRFVLLILPAPGHPYPPFDELRNWYVDRYPPAAEDPALGLVGAVGFLLLLAFGLGAMARARRARAPRPGSRADTLAQLSALTWVAFLLSTAGGFGLLVSMAVIAVRGWNRMSIVITLLALAAVGLAVEAVLARLVRRFAGRRVLPPSGTLRVLAATLLLFVGVADQSLTQGIPDPHGARDFHDDETYFRTLEASLPAGAAIFQLPYRPYPESGRINDTTESDQLRAFMNTETLRFSGGGIKGRPQTDWPEAVSREPTQDMVTDMAVIGFSGILIDRFATDDLGRSLERRLLPHTGAPVQVSADGRWSYLTLARQESEVALTMSAEARAAEAARLTRSDG